MAPSWQAVALARQRHRDETLAKVAVPDVDAVLPRNVTAIPGQVLTSKECAITALPVEALAAQIAAGALTARETVQAFLRRAALAQKLVNCITELLPEQALCRAEELDAYFAQHGGQVVGPLHGIPISVKEHVGIKGLTLNAGFVGWADRVAPDDATLLRYLAAAGCVFYARTTEPQTLMQIETATNLFGVTVNPFNTHLTPGGSSGGEGALIGLRGSCLGVATDIGGSIRVPAANNGLYGFKPTALRLPSGGMVAAMRGADHIQATPGPIATSLAGVKLFMKAVLDQQPHRDEPGLVPVPWREDCLRQGRDKARIKVAVLWHDGVVQPHAPVVRAMRELVQRLAARPDDFAVVDWVPYRHEHAWAILSALYMPDGAQDVLETVAASGEPLLPLSEWIVNETSPARQPLTVRETWAWQAERNAYRAAYNALWNSTGTGTGTGTGPGDDAVDVLLCPAGPGAAPPLGASRYWNYTAVWNLLDYPALVFPATTVDPALDRPDAAYKPMNDRDAFNHGLYDDPATYADAPVCLQLVGRRFEDEKVIGCFERIKEALA